MKLNIIDIATSMMRSANRAIATMSGVLLTQMPLVNQEPIPEFIVRGSRGTFVSVVQFDQKEKKWAKGVIVVYISGEQIQTLFSKQYEIDTTSADAEIVDVCGEFCNVVAGGFKKELVDLGYGEMQIEVPVNYYQEVSQKLKLTIHNKYELIFTHAGADLLKVDVAMESPD